MKDLNFYELRGRKVMGDLNKYVESLVNDNQRLVNRLREFDKDEEIAKKEKELQEIRRNSLYEMNELESGLAKEFSQKHWEECKSNIRYVLEGTGIGTALGVQCKKCNKLDWITDTSNW